MHQVMSQMLYLCCLFKPHRIQGGVGSIIGPLLIYEALHSEMLSNLPEVTQLVSGRAGGQTQAFCLQTAFTLHSGRFLHISSEKLQSRPMRLCPVTCLKASGCSQLCLF